MLSSFELGGSAQGFERIQGQFFAFKHQLILKPLEHEPLRRSNESRDAVRFLGEWHPPRPSGAVEVVDGTFGEIKVVYVSGLR